MSLKRAAILKDVSFKGKIGNVKKKKKMTDLVMKIVIDVDEYEQLKLAASKLAESEKIIKEHLKIKPEPQHPEETQTNSDLDQAEEVL